MTDRDSGTIELQSRRSGVGDRDLRPFSLAGRHYGADHTETGA